MSTSRERRRPRPEEGPRETIGQWRRPPTEGPYPEDRRSLDREINREVYLDGEIDRAKLGGSEGYPRIPQGLEREIRRIDRPKTRETTGYSTRKGESEAIDRLCGPLR
jgi:hypothetical protein